MSNDYMPQTGESLTPASGHEPNELTIRGMVYFTLALAATSALVMWAMTHLMDEFGVEEQSLKALAPPKFKNDPGAFPEPRLQPDPATDLATYKSRQLSHLNGLGWIDPNKKVAHVPIDRAIDLVADGAQLPWTVLKGKTPIEMRATASTNTPQMEKK